jgi:tetratricopeptide (TPR) repeat protein
VAAAWLTDQAVRDALVAALDDWAACAGKPRRRDWLLAVARRADPDPWRDRVRDPAVWDDPAALARLASEKEAADQSPQLLVALATRLQGEEQERLLRRAEERHPQGFWLNFDLGWALAEGKKPGEAVGFYRAALALRPGTYAVYTNLGVALADKGHLDEAIACYHKAIVLDPKSSPVHTNLGLALERKGRLDEAIACFRRAIALDPKLARAHYNLGVALRDKGKVDEAIRHYRKAIALDNRYAEAHCNLGAALRRQGRLTESLESYRRGHALGSKRPGWSYPSLRWVRQVRRLVRLEKDLPDVLFGRRKPVSEAERVEYAGVCTLTKRYQSAARLYADAFAARPGLADDLQAAHRYNAACAAVLAAGQGRDAPKPDDKERGRLRRQALGWLQADLALWGKEAQKGTPQARAVVQKTLRHWQKDSDLAGVRQAAALAKLPEAERAEWQKLWDEVAALLKTYGEGGKP